MYTCLIIENNSTISYFLTNNYWNKSFNLQVYLNLKILITKISPHGSNKTNSAFWGLRCIIFMGVFLFSRMYNNNNVAEVTFLSRRPQMIDLICTKWKVLSCQHACILSIYIAFPTTYPTNLYITIPLCYFDLACFLKYSSCIYYTSHMFVLCYIIYVVNIDVSKENSSLMYLMVNVRRTGWCWPPVVTFLAHIFTVYMSCYYYFVSNMYCMNQAK